MTDINASLAELLKQPEKPPAPISKAWAPRVTIADNELTLVTEPADEELEMDDDDISRILLDHNLQPGKWTVTKYDTSKWQNSGGTWLYSYKLSAKPTGPTFGVELPDLDDIERAVAQARRTNRRRVGRNPILSSERTANLVISDEQFGKTGSRGTTEDTLGRYRRHLEVAIPHLLGMKARQACIWFPGDGFEGFENVASQARTNDLSQTEMSRLLRRASWRTVHQVSQLFEEVHVFTVPSNHTTVRSGKNKLDVPGDDWGVEMLAQLSDMAEVNPDLYDHVKFYTPDKHGESLNFTTAGGINVGLAHGDQSRSGPEGMDKWWAGQSHGRTDVGHSDILIHGHWHTPSLSVSGAKRTRMGAPTLDNGSDWFSNATGNSSGTGMLSFSLDSSGWGDYRIA